MNFGKIQDFLLLTYIGACQGPAQTLPRNCLFVTTYLQCTHEVWMELWWRLWAQKMVRILICTSQPNCATCHPVSRDASMYKKTSEWNDLNDSNHLPPSSFPSRIWRDQVCMTSLGPCLWAPVCAEGGFLQQCALVGTQQQVLLWPRKKMDHTWTSIRKLSLAVATTATENRIIVILHLKR